MAKAKTIYFCQECGYESAKWQGQCPGCRQWNTFVEEVVERKATASAQKQLAAVRPVILADIEMKREERFSSGFPELDRVLGGGIVPASLVLVGGGGVGRSWYWEIYAAAAGVPEVKRAEYIRLIYFRGRVAAAD